MDKWLSLCFWNCETFKLQFVFPSQQVSDAFSICFFLFKNNMKLESFSTSLSPVRLTSLQVCYEIFYFWIIAVSFLTFNDSAYICIYNICSYVERKTLWETKYLKNIHTYLYARVYMYVWVGVDYCVMPFPFLPYVILFPFLARELIAGLLCKVDHSGHILD